MNNIGEKRIFLEGHKSFFNYFRHITTLDTAAILIMVAFFERAFKDPKLTFLAIISFGFFLLSLICSVLIMHRFVLLIWHEEESTSPPKIKKLKRRFLIWGSVIGFIIGVILLGLFGAVNILFPYHPSRAIW